MNKARQIADRPRRLSGPSVRWSGPRANGYSRPARSPRVPTHGAPMTLATLLLTLMTSRALAAGGGARGPSLSTQMPSLADVLRQDGWQAAPELSGIFQPGRVFIVDGAAHVLAVAECTDTPPVRSTYTGMEVVSQLQGGVRVRLGAATAEASAGLAKSLKFGAPVHISLPAMAFAPTSDCREALSRSPPGAYVIREALEAEIAEQTCGRVDATGRFAVFGQADASLAESCAQVSLEPVIVAVRVVPIEQWLASQPGGALPRAGAGNTAGRAATTVPDSGAANGSSAASAKPDPFVSDTQQKAAAIVEARRWLDQHEAAMRRTLDAAEAQLRAEAAAAFEAATSAVQADQDAAVPLLEAFIAKYQHSEASAVVAGEVGRRPVEIPEVEAARALLMPASAGREPTPGVLLADHGMRMVRVSLRGRVIEVSDTEVTQSAWQAVMGTNPARFDRCKGDCPVEQVSWLDAIAFCNALSETEGLTPAYAGTGTATKRLPGASGYRLMTRSEWEILAGDEADYAGGDDIRQVGWTTMNSEGSPHPVRERRPTKTGLFDLSGNVAEWMEDGGLEMRSVAGGCWSGPAMEASRHGVRTEPISYRGDDVGLRVVRDHHQD